MKNLALSVFIKYAIIVFALLGFLMCAQWYPLSISLTTVGLVDPNPLTAERSIQFWSQLLFYWLTSLPCFFILAIWWKIAQAIKNDCFFTHKVCKILNISAVILLVDLLLFLLGNLLLFLLGLNVFWIMYLFIFALGLAIVGVITTISFFTKKATIMQEDLDGTV